MKHFLLLSFFLAFTITPALAQLEVSPNPWIGTIDDLDLTDLYAEGVAHAKMKNTSGDTLYVRWEVVVISAPAEWKFLFCDKNQCYSTTTTTNWDPANDIEEPAILAPGEEGTMDLHIRPRLVAGACEVEVRLSLISNPNNVLTTGVFQVTVPTGVDEISVRNLRIFPNPSSDYFAVTNSQGLHKIVMYNVVGRAVRSFEVLEGKKYYIADLPDGIYLASLVGNNDEVLRTLRVSKRSLRP